MKIQIDYSLPQKEIANEALAAGGVAVLYQIEGYFAISIVAKRFLEDPYMNLLELAACFYKWLYIHGAASDFVFVSIDHDEPILVFAQVGEEIWTVDSIWKKGDQLQVERKELLSAVEEYLVRLNYDLQERYGLKIASFVECVP
ncbi:MAG: hypothetical protein Q8S19_07930 [Bacillota bacterium]|nr:hypothetical protein [Bacillota bacterium]